MNLCKDLELSILVTLFWPSTFLYKNIVRDFMNVAYFWMFSSEAFWIKTEHLWKSNGSSKPNSFLRMEIANYFQNYISEFNNQNHLMPFSSYVYENSFENYIPENGNDNDS